MHSQETFAAIEGRGLAQLPVVVPTNRYNLLEILSSGLIYPSAGYDKYYEDLLQRVPGRLVLVRGPVTDGVIAEVSREGENAFPVAVELRIAAVTGEEVPAFDGTDWIAASIGAEDVEAWAPASVLPLSAVAAVHFRSQDELTEHSAREYANVVATVDLRVTPELFGGPGDRVLDGLAAVDLGPAEVSARELSEGDAYAGGAAAIAARLPGEPTWLMDWANLVKAKRLPARTGDTPMPPWLAGFLVGAKPKSDEDKAFAAVCDALKTVRGSDRWAPSEIIQAVGERLPRTVSSHREMLEEIEAVVIRMDRDKRSLTADDPPAMGALMMFLERRDPAELLESPSRGTVDDGLMLTALAYAGVYSGYKRLDDRFKRGGIHRFLTDHLADRIDMPDKPWHWKPGKFATRDEGSDVVLTAGKADVLWRPARTVDVKGTLMTGPAEDIHSAALELCRALGWHDCVLTLMTGSATRTKIVEVEGESRLEIALKGLAEPAHEIDIGRFRERLGSQDLEPGLAKRLVDLLP